MSLLGDGCTVGKPCRYSSFSMMDYLSCYLHRHFEVSDFTGGEGQAGTERVTKLEQNQQKKKKPHRPICIRTPLSPVAYCASISIDETHQPKDYHYSRSALQEEVAFLHPASIGLPCGNGCLEDISEAAKACRISLRNGTLYRGLSG